MKKFLAVLISLCLLETSVLGSTGLSSRASNVKEETGISDTLINYGSVTFFENKHSSDALIIIQDLHCHPGVQRNISSAIEYLYTNYKIGNVFVEGAAGDIDLGWLTSIKNKDFAARVAENLLNSGKLTGAEYFAYKNNLSGILKGIEEKDVHLENLQRLAEIVELRPEITSVLDDMKKELDFVQDANYSAANKKISRLYGKYKSGAIDSEKYYRRLLKISKDVQNNKNTEIFSEGFSGLKDFPEIEKYINFEKSRKNLNVKKAESQLFSVISALKNKLPYGEYAEFVRNTDSFRDINAVCGYIGNFAGQGLVDLNGMKDLQQVLDNSFAYKDINPISLVRAEKRFLKHLQLSASESAKEALITVLSELFDNFSDYYKAKLDSEGYIYLKNFGIDNYKKYWKETVSEKYIAYFEDYDALFGKYYDTNLDRDGIFAKCIEKAFSGEEDKAARFPGNESYENILSQSKELNIVVCGGFHTYGLINEVKKQDISYIVITPKVEGDAALSDTIYEDILLSSHTVSAYAIALQILSQTGQANQFSEIINAVIYDELALNPDADLTALINDVVNEVCNPSVPAPELEKNALRSYDKPVNKGVTVDDNGKVTLNIYFEGSEKEEEIQFSLYGNSASFFGERFKKTAPFWEWLYMLPFSSILLDSKQAKKVMKNFFSPKQRNAVHYIRYTNAMKVIDGLSSAFFIAAIATSFFTGGAFFAAVIGFFAARALIFAAGHNNIFNFKGNGTALMRICAGAVFSVPAALFILFSAAPVTIVFYGIAGNILLHTLFNFIAPAFTSKKERNFFFTGEDFIRSFSKFRKESSSGERVSSKTMADFLIHARAFNENKDARIANMAMPIFLDIVEMYRDREKGGSVINSIARSLSSQLGYIDENIVRELISQNNRLYNYLIVLHYRNNPQQLREYVYDKYNLAPQFRLYALLHLKLLGESIDRNAEAELISEAGSLIKNFKWERDITENEGWLYNAELQAYVMAVYMVMTKGYSFLAGEQSRYIFKRISNARFDALYNNANASLSFGKEFFKNPVNREIFPEIIAHELAHINLSNRGLKTAKPLFLGRDLQAASVHELYADVSGYLMSIVTGRPATSLRKDLNLGFSRINDTTFNEEHFAARTQFAIFKEALDKNHIPFSVQVFSQTLADAVDGRLNAKGKDKKKLYFRDLFFEVYERYVNEYGYAVVPPRNLNSNMYLFSSTLAGSTYLKGSVLGEDLADYAPVWESAFALPFSSLITESDFFKVLISKLTKKADNRLSMPDIDNAIQYSIPLKIADAVLSVFFITALFMPVLAVPAAITFLLSRAFIFVAAHDNMFNSIREKAGLLFGMGLLMSLPLAFGVIFAGSIPLTLAAVPAGLGLNMLIHSLINKHIDGIAARMNAKLYTDEEIIDYFRNFKKEAEDVSISPLFYGRDDPALISYRSMLRVLKYNKNPDTLIAVIGDIKDITRILSYKGKTGTTVNFSSDILAEKIGKILQAGRNSPEARKIYEVLGVSYDELSDQTAQEQYLILRSFKNEPETLRIIAENERINIKSRFYAYLMLKTADEEVSESVEANLREQAKAFLKTFTHEKFLEEAEDMRWMYNEDLKAYMTAVAVILSGNGYFLEGNAVYKAIDARARLEAEYGDANSSFRFGREYIPKKQNGFTSGIAHELGHGYLDLIGFKITAKDNDMIHMAAIHEFFADITAIILNIELEKDYRSYIKSVSVTPYDKEGDKFYYTTVDEPHTAARTQLNDLIDIMTQAGHETDWNLLSQILKNKIVSVKNKHNKDFAEVIYASLKEYAQAKDIFGTDTTANLKKEYIVEREAVEKTFKFGSIMGDGYADVAPFWEWVYMLPGVSFFAESKIFSKLLSKSFLKGLSEKRIQNTLKSEKSVKILDIAGVTVASVSVISGFGLAGMAAYLLSRAIIFSQAHKGLDWKDKIMMSVVLFGVPGILAAAVIAGFTAFSVVPFLAIGVPLNIFFHVFYNKVLVPALSLRNASIAGNKISGEDIAGEIRAALSRFLPDSSYIDVRITELPYIKNSIYEDRIYFDKKTNKFVLSIRESFVQALTELEDHERTEYIGKYAGNIAQIFNSEFKKGNDILNSFSFNEEFSIKKAAEDNLFAEFDKLVLNYEIQNYLSGAIKFPSFENMGNMAENMLASGYPFSKVNREMLSVIVKASKYGNILSEKDRYKFFEFLGYILQSQARLAPSESNAQIGFMQHYGMSYKYERVGAETDFAERILEKLFDLERHPFSTFAKSKQAALFDHLVQTTDMFATAFVPSSLADGSLMFPKNELYSSEELLSPERFAAKISDAGFSKSRIVVNCSDFENISDVVKAIEEYNNSASSDRRITQVLFYDADIVDYELSSSSLSFDTAFIFDFSKFTQRLDFNKDALRLFTAVPAVYVGTDEINFDSGSRLDSFSINYLYMLMEGFREMNFDREYLSSYYEKAVSVMPEKETAIQTVSDYEALIKRLKEYDNFDAFGKVFYKTIMRSAKENLKILSEFLDGRDISAQDVNNAVNDYRTLLNFLFYLRFSNSSGGNGYAAKYQKKMLSDEYNMIIRKPKDSSGEEIAQDTVFVTSGMSAVKSIASFYAAQEIRNILVGRNIYFETAELLDEMNLFQIYHVDEADTEGIVHSHKFSRASFIDLVSHSVKTERMSSHQLDDIIVADIKKIVEETAKSGIKEPFYLTIDNSLYPSFQFADILDGIDLPDNFYIVIYGSMQKMHQKGLDIAASGMITLISNGYRHNEVLSGLEAMSGFTSSDIDMYRYSVLDEFITRQDNLFGYVGTLNQNAIEYASVLDEVAKIFGSQVSVVHPSTDESQALRSWQDNKRPGIPIFFIRNNTLEMFSPYGFSGFMQKAMQAEGFYDFTSRNSFGFTLFTEDIYVRTAVRYNAGTAQGETKEKLIKALVYGTFDFLYAANNDSSKVIDTLYNYIDGNTVNNKFSKEKIYEYVTDKKRLENITGIDTLKAFIILSKLNIGIPREMIPKVEDALKYSVSITLKSSAEQSVYDEAAAYLSEKIMKDKVSGIISSGRPLYEHIGQIYDYLKKGGADTGFIENVFSYFSNENIINSVNGTDLLKLMLIFDETGHSVPATLRSRALAFAENLDPEEMSADERAVFVEAYKHISGDLKRKDVIGWYAGVWSGGSSVEMAAAARSLASLLGEAPGVNNITEDDDVSDVRNYIDGVEGILSAA